MLKLTNLFKSKSKVKDLDSNQLQDMKRRITAKCDNCQHFKEVSITYGTGYVVSDKNKCKCHNICVGRSGVCKDHKYDNKAVEKYLDVLKREEIGYDEQCPKVINVGVKKNV